MYNIYGIRYLCEEDEIIQKKAVEIAMYQGKIWNKNRNKIVKNNFTIY